MHVLATPHPRIPHIKATPRRPAVWLSLSRWCAVATVTAFMLGLSGPRAAAQPSQPATLPPPNSIILTPNHLSPQPVATPITWTAIATDTVPLVYRFGVSTVSTGPFVMVRDYSPRNYFTWAPLQEGTYYIEVTIKEGFTATATASTIAEFTLSSRVVGGKPVITPTDNPLVALYSAPACSAGS